MIKANELRIGNWLEWRNPNNENIEPIKIEVADIVTIENKNRGHYYSPIPLTPEILEKAGFKKQYTESNIGITVEETRNMQQYGGTRTYFIGWSNSKIHVSPEMNCCGSTKLHSVHQLQNLYFALTGEELNIQL